MIKNYLKIALRNFVKERFYGLINVLGLSIGVASSLVIMLYVAHDLSYDDFHPDVDRTYRVNQTLIWSPGGGIMSSTTLPLAGLLASEYPEVESALRINTPGNSIVRYEDDQYKHNYFENSILAADSNFFEFFDFKLKEGDPSVALKGLNKVVISSETAYKYFGDEPALGKMILFGSDRTPMEVTGVTEVQPTNSHFHFDFLLSMYSNPNIKRFEWSWIWTQVVTYVKLRPGADPLAQVYAILFAAPLLITVLAIPILGEVVRIRRWIAVIVGLTGVMIVLQPGATPLELGHLAALTAAIGGSFASIIVRKIGRDERTAVMMLYPMIANFLVMGALLPFVYKPVPIEEFGMMASIAVLGFTGALCLIAAYKSGEAVIVAPMQYSQIIWASVFGALFFDEQIGQTTAIGAGVIIASGLYIVLRESRGGGSENRPVLRTRSRVETGTAPRVSQSLDPKDRGP